MFHIFYTQYHSDPKLVLLLNNLLHEQNLDFIVFPVMAKKRKITYFFFHSRYSLLFTIPYCFYYLPISFSSLIMFYVQKKTMRYKQWARNLFSSFFYVPITCYFSIFFLFSTFFSIDLFFQGARLQKKLFIPSPLIFPSLSHVIRSNKKELTILF